MPVPNIFALKSGRVPAAELDQNFAALDTAITDVVANNRASQAEAEAQASNTKFMTPLRIAQWAANRIGNALLLSGLTAAADKIAFFSSSSAMSLTDLVSQARSFLANPSAAFVTYTSPLSGGVARAASNKMDETISLLDVLTDAERADVLAGTNAIDITAKFRQLLIDTHTYNPGALIDAMAWRGTVDLTSDPFGLLSSLKVKLLTGAATLRVPVNGSGVAASLKLPSHMHWDGQGLTTITAQAAVADVDASASPCKALVTTSVFSEYCSGTSGEMTVTIPSGSAGDIIPGCRFAIIGISDYAYISHTLNGAIDASVTTLTLAVASDVKSTIAGSLVYLKIGTEIIKGVVNGNYVSSTGVVTVSTGGRGALGTTAASHANGATVTIMQAFITEAVSVAGTTVTIADALPMTFTDAIWLAGAVDNRLSGVWIDGGYTEGDTLDDNWCALGSPLSTRFTLDGSVRLMNAPHGGYIGFAARQSRIRGHSIESCTRPDNPDVPTGAAIWDFGGGLDNVIEFDVIDQGNLAVALDNKSYGLPEWGLINGSAGANVKIGALRNYLACVNISGSSGNVVEIGYLATGIPGPVFADGRPQTTTAVPTTANTVIVKAAADTIVAAGDALVGNTLVLGGRRSLSGTWTDTAGRTLTYLTGTSTTFTATGVKIGDNIHLQDGPGFALPASVGYKAKCTTDDVIAITFLNCENTSHVMAANDIVVDWWAEGPL